MAMCQGVVFGVNCGTSCEQKHTNGLHQEVNEAHLDIKQMGIQRCSHSLSTQVKRGANWSAKRDRLMYGSHDERKDNNALQLSYHTHMYS